MANNTMTKLATTTVGAGGASSVTFSNIPQNYTDLILKTSARANTNTINVAITFNGSNLGYSERYMYGYNSTTTGSGSSSGSAFNPQFTNDGTYTANAFNNGEIYIPNYTSSNFKSISLDNVTETNATSAWQMLYAGLQNSTLPVTSITLSLGANSFVQYSEFTLYGVYAGGTTTPSAPTIASATDLGGGTAQVTISSPAAIPYTVTSNPSGITATGMSPINISGLSPQTSYTFTAQAVAPFGVSAASSASSSISMYNGMTALATVSVGVGGASSILFSSIPSGYSHLQIRGVARGTNTGTSGFSWFKTNGNSTATSHYLASNGTTVSTSGYVGSGSPLSFKFPMASATSGIFGAVIIDFLDYANTNKYKTARILNGYDTNGNGEMWLSSYVYTTDTSAITSIEFIPWDLSTFAQYSTFVLYGVK